MADGREPPRPHRDVAPEPGALDALLHAAGEDPGSGVLAPMLVLTDGSTQHSLNHVGEALAYELC